MGKISLKGSTALITGASSGIGKACAEHLARIGVNLVITARRSDRLAKMAEVLKQEFQIAVRPVELDVQRQEQVTALFDRLERDNVGVDILVNNAGLALSADKIQDGCIANWETMIDTNLKGLLYMTRAFLPPMMARNRGHIINIGSVAGHDCYPAGNIYCATKHAVRAISKSLRIDLLGTFIRVSEIDPGAVETEFSEVRWKDKAKAKKVYEGYQPLVADDVADAVVYCATRPVHVNIAEMIVYPQAQASVTHVSRQTDGAKDIFAMKQR